MRCDYVSWMRFQGMCAALAQRIRADGFQPDAIIGIARGGYMPARVLADLFGLINLAAIKIEHYQGTRKSRQALIRHPLPDRFAGRRVLLVDDVSDSGDTFAVALDHLRQRGGLGEIRTAVLHHKLTSSYTPDYFAHRVVSWRWIIYPWALTEDLQTLIGAMSPRPATAEEAGRQLRERHGLKIPCRIVAEVLPFVQPRGAVTGR